MNADELDNLDDEPPLTLRTKGSASAAALAQLGRVIAGKYEIVRLLGEGGMGAVYEARNRATLKRCAIKLMLSPELAQISDVVHRFHREAKACSVVESDHIVSVFDSGSDDDTSIPYIVMELLTGEDLQNLLDRVGTLAPPAAARVALQAASGLAKAHELGIVHRDVKPANLFLTRRDNGELLVKVLDFGVAKIKMDNFSATHHDLTRTGAMIGTPRYMSPEQARGISKVDVRSDVWSLGVVLYEMLCGGSPYADTSALGELLLSIVTEDIPLLQDKAPWVSRDLAEITHRAMSRDISKRFANASELRDALARFVGDSPALTPDMLVPVAPETRTRVEPKLVLTDDAMLRATGRTGLSMARVQSVPPRRAVMRVALGVGAAVVAAAAVGVVFGARALRPATHAAPERTLSVPSAEMPTAGKVQMSLSVSPADVTVTVDGRPADVVDGKVAITGVVGTTCIVALSRHGTTRTEVVAVTRDGLVPSEVALTIPDANSSASGAAPTTPTRHSARKGDAPPAGAKAAGPAATPRNPSVTTDTSEFK